ncbi:MAG: hypothetical protein LBR21_10115, partial [Propionibacteriaceae bacterium]|nr:hypothetical protein [Propionibacteriaceae bacterium]
MKPFRAVAALLALTTAFALASATLPAYGQDLAGATPAPGILPPLDRGPDPVISNVHAPDPVVGPGNTFSGSVAVPDNDQTILKLSLIDGQRTIYTAEETTMGGKFSFDVPERVFTGTAGHSVDWILTAADETSLVLSSGEVTPTYSPTIKAKFTSGYRIKARISLSVPDGVRATGKILVSVGKWKKKISAAGKHTVLLPRLTKGKHKV